jgi:hypothetical protein
MTKDCDPCLLFNDENPFGTDNRPVFNCYREGHAGPYVLGGPLRGICCRSCYAEAQKALGWLNPKRPEEPSIGANPR